MTINYAMLFPGQGSQRVGMLGDLAAANSSVEQTFSEASEILEFDLWDLALNGPEEKIKKTEFTQPLMLASGVATGRVWLSEVNEEPRVVAGHSVGEIAALVIAGAISFKDSVKLVRQRSSLMASAVPEGEGGMAAVIGMDDNDVVALCKDVVAQLKSPMVLEAVNFNAPGQVVISGHLTAIEAAIPVATERGARKVMRVPVSVPNHSSLMRTAGETLAETIDSIEWKQAAFPVMQNQNADLSSDAETLKATLKLHVQSPVQWVKSVRSMIDNQGVCRFFEMGPGKVLTGLGKRIERSVETLPVFDPDSLQTALDSLTVENA